MQIQNPILRGFNPDPSIVRVGDDFYIATSSFSYFPGIPIYHSRDLVNWRRAGYAFSRADFLPLTPDRVSGGLFAPTLRYHGGLFYVIVANMSVLRTYVVTAEDPAGPWSAPHELPLMFDPDLFWDGGVCYVSYASFSPNFRHRIVHRRLDTDKWEMTGDETDLWGGALVGAASPEAPHLYKIGDYYYLLIAEGGTEHHHAVTVARSKSVNGPFEGYSGNPILTHRHLSRLHPICNVGHADLVELKDGSWYAVFLGSRLIEGYHKNMGRETFLAPVIWEDGWPVIAPKTGKCEWTYPAPNLPAHPFPTQAEGFDVGAPGSDWNFLGTPVGGFWRLDGKNLLLRAVAESIRPADLEKLRFRLPRGNEAPEIVPRALSFVGRRQEHASFAAGVDVDFEPADAQSAGLVVLQHNFNELTVELAREDGRKIARCVKHRVTTVGGPFDGALEREETVLGTAELPAGTARLEIRGSGQTYSFFAGGIPVAEGVRADFLGSETAGGFVGAYIGVFATGNGTESDAEARFSGFSCADRELNAPSETE